MLATVDILQDYFVHSIKYLGVFLTWSQYEMEKLHFLIQWVLCPV